jgi:hypothetical protein
MKHFNEIKALHNIISKRNSTNKRHSYKQAAHKPSKSFKRKWSAKLKLTPLKNQKEKEKSVRQLTKKDYTPHLRYT